MKYPSANKIEIRDITAHNPIFRVVREFSSMAESISIDSLPNEILRKILYFAVHEQNKPRNIKQTKKYDINHKNIVDVISKVSNRFKDIVSDP